MISNYFDYHQRNIVRLLEAPRMGVHLPEDRIDNFTGRQAGIFTNDFTKALFSEFGNPWAIGIQRF